MIKKCSSDGEKLFELEAESREFAKVSKYVLIGKNNWNLENYWKS